MNFAALISGFRDLYFQRRFFTIAGIAAVLFAMAFQWGFLFIPALILLSILAISTIIDLLFLFSTSVPLEGRRDMAKILSLGDENEIQLKISNLSSLDYAAVVIEEYPEQLQIRDISTRIVLPGRETVSIAYTVRPTDRALLKFGGTNVLLSGKLNLVQRRIHLPTTGTIAVYPSIIQMKKFELHKMQKTAYLSGIKRMRKIGLSYEFEQIANYVPGDDFRHINWKATGKQNHLMINQYVEEKSQQVYCIIDKSRNMMMPFNGMTLLDHAINTALVISNISLAKEDRAGIISFSDRTETYLKAQNRPGQLSKILEALYNEQNSFTESNYEALYFQLKRYIPNRSLIFLFTNFESLYNLKRNLSVLRKISRSHLLIVVLFENTEISKELEIPAENIEDIYIKTMAKKISQEKWQMVQELSRHGIISIYTRPEDLTINSINKYLEIKARGTL